MAAYFWQRAFVAIALFFVIFLIHFLTSPNSQEFMNFILPHEHVQKPPSQWNNFTALVRESTRLEPKNLVVITSMIHGAKPSVFTPEQRLTQLISSIDSVKEKIPDAFIVVAEGGSRLNHSTVEKIQGQGVTLWHFDVRGMPKAVGDAQLLYSFLRMPHDFTRFKSISKLSGRYYLTKDFNFNPDLNSSIAKIDTTKGVVQTRYYRVPPAAAHLLKHALLLMILPHDEVRAHVKIDQDDTLDEVLFKTKVFEAYHAIVPKVLGIRGLSAVDGKPRDF